MEREAMGMQDVFEEQACALEELLETVLFLEVLNSMSDDVSQLASLAQSMANIE